MTGFGRVSPETRCFLLIFENPLSLNPEFIKQHVSILLIQFRQKNYKSSGENTIPDEFTKKKRRDIKNKLTIDGLFGRSDADLLKFFDVQYFYLSGCSSLESA